MRDVRDLSVEGKTVLVRADLNVPLRDGVIGDDTRIRAALPTLQHLLDAGAAVVVCSHLGRPKGQVDQALSLRPVADRLSDLLGRPVALAAGVAGPAEKAAADALEPGQVLLLENVRFEPGETKNDPELSAAFAALADAYVNDAFGAAHRAHASTAGVAELLPCAAGFLLQKEVETIEGVLADPKRPLVAIVGGSKVSDKILVLERFLEVADRVLVGGAMVFPLLKALGHSVGNSLCAAEDDEHAVNALAAASREGAASLELPTDLVIAKEFSAEAEHEVLAGVDVPDGWMGLDIGPDSAAADAAALADAGSVFWNGPMGAFEMEPYAAGTRTVAEAVAACPGTTVIGGGDSAAAIEQFGFADQVDWVSTGGGAALELIEGRALPGVEALR
jgi:phosphoglycerate kinase